MKYLGYDLNMSEKIILGIDEAGRGPVIGPMVMAGCLTNETIDQELKELGIKDSKLIAPKKRKHLVEIIKKKVLAYHIEVLSPDDIDTRDQKSLNLNQLEAVTSVNIMKQIKKTVQKPFITIMDSPTNTPAPYIEYVRDKLQDTDITVLAEVKADMNYPSVSAASILAKVLRDELIEDMQKKVEVHFKRTIPIGSGYPSDPTTKKFIAEYWDRLNFVEGGFFRKTWATYKNIAEQKKQKNLGDY